ncbi:hypothetical protein K8I61_14875, partial [bacterium]|nr:hypothetical protein [bacterium]
ASAGERVAKEHIETLAVIDRAVEREMAVRLDDVIFRRTGLGTTGVLDPAAVEKVGRRMASRLGWNAEKTHAQIEEVAGKLASRGIGRERNGDSDRREDKKK